MLAILLDRRALIRVYYRKRKMQDRRRGGRRFTQWRFTWNVRGLGLQEKCGAICRFIKRIKLTFFFFKKPNGKRETKKLLKEIWGVTACDSFYRPSDGRFTWSSGQARATMSKLGRFLTSEEWDSIFSSASQIKLFCPISDHCPIMYDSDQIDWGPKPFRFNHAWLQDPRFVGLVKEWWASFSVYGWGGFFFLSQKLNLKSRNG